MHTDETTQVEALAPCHNVARLAGKCYGQIVPGNQPWNIAVVALLWLGALGCLVPRKVEPLGDAVRLYNDAVRWQRFDRAAARVPVRVRDEFLDERDRLSRELRISEYDVVRVRHDATARRARVHIKYIWHLDSRGVVHETHTVQRWERPRKHWVLLSEHHLRGEPMPGVAPAENDAAESTDEKLGRTGAHPLRDGLE